MTSRPTLTKRPLGFTLVELVILFGIVGVIAAIVIPMYGRYIEKARVVEAIAAMRDIQSKVKAYQRANGALPASLATLAYDKADPWGRAYVYVILVNPGVARKDKKLAPLNSDYDLYSMGKDGITHASLSNSASRDDIVRARDGGFVGPAEEFDP